MSRQAADPMKSETRHPTVDFERWASLFPIETFEKTEGPRRYASSPPDDPIDLWKARGTAVTSPADLCEIELVRRRVAKGCDLGTPVPVDLFLWSTAPPKQPYLTKLGGTPHREASKPWPTRPDGKPFTFVAQFCFLDSKDVVSEKLPGDVMLVFFADAEGVYKAPSGLRIEWSDIDLRNPLAAADCPPPGFPVPQLSGVIHRTNEYPESWECFDREGHDSPWFFARTQATKIGRETHFIQNDPRGSGRELLCTLNSLQPNGRWPFVDLETPPSEKKDPDAPYGWGRYRMMFGDVGCIYFLIDEAGKVTWDWDCY